MSPMLAPRRFASSALAASMTASRLPWASARRGSDRSSGAKGKGHTTAKPPVKRLRLRHRSSLTSINPQGVCYGNGMDASARSRRDHELPTSGSALDAVAFSATLHCLTGCALGEIAGMIIGTALGFSDWGTVALAVALAFLFGYSLTSLPLLRAGLAPPADRPVRRATARVCTARTVV